MSAWANVTDRLIQQAYEEAAVSGMGAMDALHVVAAKSLDAEQLIISPALDPTEAASALAEPQVMLEGV